MTTSPTASKLVQTASAGQTPTVPMDQVPVVVIRPASGWASLELPDLWRYRHLLPMLLKRDVTSRYRQTMLGPIWFVIGPLMRMLVFSLILGRVAQLPSDGVPYPIFIYTALLPWELFAGGVGRGTASLVSYMPIISKVYFPRLLVPLAAVLSGLVDFLISMVILLVMVLAYGFPLTPRLLVLPPLVLLTMTLALAIGLFLAALQVRYRDVSNAMGYVVQFWFYFTPVVYAASLVTDLLPEGLAWLYGINPMTIVVEGFRWAVLGVGDAIGWIIVPIAVAVTILCILGAFYFRRTEHSIVDLL